MNENINDINTIALYEDILTLEPKYDTFGENLYWSWANWEVIQISIKGKVMPFERPYYMMRQKFFMMYKQGERHMADLYTFNKTKLRAGDVCFYCHKEVPKEKLTADHVFPRVKGGSNDLNNIIFVCKNCNSSKGKKELLQWFMIDRKEMPSPFILGHYLKQINLYAIENDLLSMPFSEVETMQLPFSPRSILLLHTRKAHHWYFETYKQTI